MQLKRLFTDDSAVSPVVGVTLMIAIAVVLAAVVGGLVLGLGQGQDPTPTTSFEFNVDSSDNVTATLDGGDSLEFKNVNATVNGGTTNTIATSGTWTAGQTKQVASGVSSGDVIRIVWSSPDSDKTSVLAKYTVQ